MFRKAEKKQSKLRLALCGPSGSGKTYSALRLATGLGGRIALIDTERGSGDLYSDKFEYDIAPIEDDFDPRNYIDLIHEAEVQGYDIIIIDSLSHAWEGEGGILDKKEKAQQFKHNNSFTAWRDVTPQHNKLVDTILQSKCHIIATMRTKTHYDMVEETKNGKTYTKPVKIGLKPVQREGMDYEFTIVLDISTDGHVAKSSKDRTGLFDDDMFIIEEQTGQKLKQWLDSGVPEPTFEDRLHNIAMPRLSNTPYEDVTELVNGLAEFAKERKATIEQIEKHPDKFVKSFIDTLDQQPVNGAA